LRTLPRPPDQPRSLLAPAAPLPPRPGEPQEYFTPDPLLDPPAWGPAPGWFARTELGIVSPHVKNRLNFMVQIGNNSPDTVAIESAQLDWTVSPRFEVGHRLPAGFGEVSLAYRFLFTQGVDLNVPAPDGLGHLKSRFNLNQIDLDYASWEFSLWPQCEMRWFFGARYVQIYFDSQLLESFDDANAGSGVSDRSDSNSYVGIGPHLGVDLEKKFEDYHLSFLTRFDWGTCIGRIKQSYYEASTTLDANGLPLRGETHISSSQAVPSINLQVGAQWNPAPPLHVFCGYGYEYWWNVGRLSAQGATLTPPRGEMSIQGFFLRAQYDF
jgi:hypothetical protein